MTQENMQFLSWITKNWFVFLSQLPFVLSSATLLSCIIEYHQLKKTWLVNRGYNIDKFEQISMKYSRYNIRKTYEPARFYFQ